ncbi:UNVERIFIED_CONTAM: hypothetical protein FKN15_002580 [Acipenser sinensis]
MDKKQNADGPNPVPHGASANSMDISSAVNPVNPLTTSLPYPAVATTTVVDTPTVCTVTISQPLGPTVSTGSQPSVRARIHRERQVQSASGSITYRYRAEDKRESRSPRAQLSKLPGGRAYTAACAGAYRQLCYKSSANRYYLTAISHT